MVVKPWIAELDAIGQYYSIVGIYNEDRAKHAMLIVNEASWYHAQYLQYGILTDGLPSSVLLLAQIDPFFLAGKVYDPFGLVDTRDIEDLKCLFATIPFARFSSRSVCLLDPTFGYSNLVGGINIDLVLDGTMIDIKTIKFLQIKREYVDQLLGYLLLRL